MSKINYKPEFQALPQFDRWFYQNYVGFHEKSHMSWYRENPKNLWDEHSPTQRFFSIFGIVAILLIMIGMVVGLFIAVFALSPIFGMTILSIIAIAGGVSCLAIRSLK